MIFSNYKIIVRIGIIISVFIFLIILLAVVGITTLNIMEEKLEEVIKRTDIKSKLAKDMRSLAQREEDEIENIVVLKNHKDQLQSFLEKKKEYEKTEDMFIEMINNDNEKALLKNIIDLKNITYSLWNNIVELSVASKLSEDNSTLLREARHTFLRWSSNLTNMVHLEKKLAREYEKNAFVAYTRLRNMMLFVSIFAAIAGAYFVFSFTYSITKPLFEFSQKIDKIAQGDFTIKINYSKNDEMGIVAQRINNMTKTLKANEEELRKYRLHLEDLVRQRTEALDLLREKFISVLIHDLKGPLTPIQGFTKRLIEGKTKSQEETRESLMAIQNSSQELLKAIENTSNILRERSNLNSFYMEEVNLKDILILVHINALPEIEDKGIKLFINNKTQSCWNDLDDFILKGDSFQLKTLIENLLGNAIKYANGTIKVELYKADSDIHLIMSDDGPGIPSEYQEKIFDEYFQIPGSKKGIGIGLYSVKKVVDSHGGKILVSSSSLKGAMFEVILPG